MLKSQSQHLLALAAYGVLGSTLHRFAGVGIKESDTTLMLQKASGRINK